MTPPTSPTSIVVRKIGHEPAVQFRPTAADARQCLYRIRAGVVADHADLIRLEADNPDWHWRKENLRQAIGRPYHVLRVLDAPKCRVVSKPGEPLALEATDWAIRGYSIVRDAAQEMLILRVMVAPHLRRMGLGKDLVGEWRAISKRRQVPLRCVVAERNLPMQLLLSRSGMLATHTLPAGAGGWPDQDSYVFEF